MANTYAGKRDRKGRYAEKIKRRRRRGIGEKVKKQGKKGLVMK